MDGKQFCLISVQFQNINKFLFKFRISNPSSMKNRWNTDRLGKFISTKEASSEVKN